MKFQRISAPLALLLIAGAAWALTEQDLQDEADRLSSVYSTLGSAIDACPGGTCGGAAQIVSDAAAASGDLDQLATDRGSLPGCPCVQVDAVISEAQAARDAVEDTIDEWLQAAGLGGRTQPML